MPLCSWSQNTPVKKISLRWQVIETPLKEREGFHASLTITNHSRKPLPSKDWSLYFNCPRQIKAIAKGNLSLDHINGDLYRITPERDFIPISGGESVRIEWAMSGFNLNLTDAPKGFYWVWDDKPDVGITVEDILIVPPAQFPLPDASSTDKSTFIDQNERTFRENEMVLDIGEEAIVKIFPTPFAYEERSGFFMITESTWIETDPEFEEVGQYLAEELYFMIGKLPALNPGSGDERNRIALKKGNTRSEAYTLSVNPARIEIKSSSAAGVFYGIQSLKTLIVPTTLKSIQRFIAVPSVEVIDGPRFDHRALLLDVARNFHSKQQVIKVIDLMALYKLNVLHLHLSDDEGWRLEISGLPELTEIGARRGHNLDGARFLQPAFGSGPGWNAMAGNGYYSRQDFIDILRYAKLNHITVIPEIETPGHARAAIVSMNSRYHRLMEEGKKTEASEFLLRDPEDQSVYATQHGWTDNIMDPGLPSTYRFIENVIDEVIDLYKDAEVPLSLIHVGGNDIPSDAWAGSPTAMSLLKGDPEIRDHRDLKRYFFRRIERILKTKGLPLYGWQEIATRDRYRNTETAVLPDPEFAHRDVIVDVHNASSAEGLTDLPFRMANAGYKVVLSSYAHFGFNLPYDNTFPEPGISAGSFVDTERAFRFQPHGGVMTSTSDVAIRLVENSSAREESLTDYGRKNIVGIKGLLWSETATNSSELEYMLLPRLFALAERAWASDPFRDGQSDSRKTRALLQEEWSHFANVLGKRELTRLDFYQGGYHYRIPAPGLMVDRGEVRANIQFPGLTMRYTTDGREPTIKSPVYTDPIPAAGIVKVRAFNSVGRGGRTSTWTSPLPLPEYSPEDQDKGDSAYTHK